MAASKKKQTMIEKSAAKNDDTDKWCKEQDEQFAAWESKETEAMEKATQEDRLSFKRKVLDDYLTLKANELQARLVAYMEQTEHKDLESVRCMIRDVFTQIRNKTDETISDFQAEYIVSTDYKLFD